MAKPLAKEPIAIIGSACRFAGGVNSPSKLWDLLLNPGDVRSEIPDSRFSARGFYHPNHAHHGHSNVLHSYLIDDDPSAFDADFFGIKPAEAQAMDPQQRMLLETVYEGIEAAGLSIEGLRHSDTGVFVGAMCADYEALQLRDLDEMPTYFATGTARSILSNRISYFFDWHGPSMTIDTACSSSLVALHQAVQALRSSEVSIAVVGGANLILGPEAYIMESKLKMLSPDGRGRMWDKEANGYARGDGVAAIVLKPLSTAIADGDHIECVCSSLVIRETGVNQDGATPGVTMPSATAQQALIEGTYARAGLDLRLRTDRPQFFEAHGTGTPAGDPIEAEAVDRAFFGPNKQMDSASHHHLYVGSIKTVLGHTEGTAGIAGVLKASLAIQNGRIPPNLLFNSLSPAVAPFCGSLEIPTVAQAWPDVPGAPRRASVNSFGFGGTNAHAILEEYESPAPTDTSNIASTPLFAPYVFSAASERSLRANLLAFSTHLDANGSYNAHDLAYTLRQRRSVFRHRVAYVAESVDGLKNSILADIENDEATPVGVRARATDKSPKILGIFTGQGAQYARMGASLVEQSPLASRIIENLESDLAQLPEADRPTWSLRSELLASSSPRVHEAAISQPLCTAVQIMLVDLLRLAHVKFNAVVGHSSGEIAAAYAARRLTARDAIIIAYYRGLHCRHAASPNGEKNGAMLAVGTSVEDATQLCEDELFARRIWLAACNSSSSVTISGDEDAIQELQVVLDDEGKFNRRLRVDQAYHSAHMLPCSDPYIESLHRANVRAQDPPPLPECMWYSSVHEGRLVGSDARLSGVYWAENLTRPVLFSQALATALADHGSFDMVLEVGAHPALKSPSSQCIHDALQHSIPYHGCLHRNTDAVHAMATALGFLWSHLDNRAVDLGTYEAALSGRAGFTLVKGLPPYQWNHSSKYWHESRRSRRMRLRKQPFHFLLGHETPDSGPHHLRWKNVLKPSEMDWLEGHRVQGQIVFPAAGYVSTVLEAAMFSAAGREVRLVELSDFVIRQAVTFAGADSSVEVLIELSQVAEDGSGALRAKFSYSAALDDSDVLTLTASADVRLLLGSASPSLLPERGPPTPHLIDVESQRLYGFMEGLGYNFTGPFRSLVKLRRKLGKASCELSVLPTDLDDDSRLLLHPIEIDAAFQSVMLAYSYPGDDQLRALHLPASIAKFRVNPALCASHKSRGNIPSVVDSTCRRADRAAPRSGGFAGHVSFYVAGCAHAALQLEGLRFVPFAGAINEDRNVFYKTDWVLAAPDGICAAEGIPVTQRDTDLLWVLSRIASYYLRKFDQEVPADSKARKEKPLCHYLNYARHMTCLLKSGKHKYAKTEWLADTLDDVTEDVERHGFSNEADVNIMFLVGETMPRVFKQETTMIEHMRMSGLLDEYYTHGFGTMQSSLWLSHTVKQLTDRNPHLNILEVGAGTGGATKNILKAIGHCFDSYTFTDISTSFFADAADIFTPWRDRLVFKAYDAERDPAEQGFELGKYDVVVASLVIHATAELSKTMRHLRSLLKPGGYLVVAEGTSDGPLQSGDGFIFGGLPGWWLGVDEGRTLSPFISVDEYDALLKRTGFSGIDTLAPHTWFETFGLVLFVSQAVDDQISFLRQPLATATPSKIAKLVVVGGATEPVAKLVTELRDIFRQDLALQMFFYRTLEDIDHAAVDETSTVIAMTELDTPVFENMTSEKWYSFRKLFESGKKLLWVSRGRLADEPWSNMPVGFGRSAVNETADLHVQFLDFPTVADVSARTVAEALVRLHSLDIGGSSDILWTAEPEVVIDPDGRHLVPRLNPVVAANNRYNSIQRPVFHEVDIGTSTVEAHQTVDGCRITELSRYDTAAQALMEPTRPTLQTTFTVLSALKTDVEHKFLAAATDLSGGRYLVLVPRLTSTLDVYNEYAVPYDLESLKVPEAAFLAAVAAHLVALAITESLLPGQSVAIHNAPALIGHAVDLQASLKRVTVFRMTDSGNEASAPSTSTRLPRYISRSELSPFLPQDLACFVGFSPKDTSENEEAILSTISHHCRRETASTIYSLDAVDSVSSMRLAPTLRKAIQLAQTTDDLQLYDSSELVSLASLATGDRPRNPLAVIDWRTESSLSVQTTRLDQKYMFKGNKTYWLCGMSGALGISVCDWMIDRGVRHLVITSRNPKVEDAWLEDHRRNGVDVRIMSCDVTDEKALTAVYESIVESMPPIAGVLNGAMVLRDSAIPNMQYDQLMDVVRPKVLGSLHLDRIFHNINLDFFILVSSINCVVGNVGQANYAAANMYMCSLAANRRKRGLNGIAINGGAIIGAGYITRETDRALDVTVQRMAMMHLSEEDFHQIVAESVESGHLDSPTGLSEITTGLLDISPSSPNIPKWYSNPKFSRFIVYQTASGEHKRDKTSAASIQDQLQACRTREDLHLLVERSFADQLRKILQVSLPDEEILSKRGQELGLDSLLSVDIRSWFLKHFGVSIPVLKIMSNDTMENLVRYAAEVILSEKPPAMMQQSGDTTSSGTVATESNGSTSSHQAEPTTPETPAADPSWQAPETEAIDWEAESTPPADFATIALTSNAPPPTTPPTVIVLTGATGLLGRHLLEYLLANTSVKTIHCLAVRNLPSLLQSNSLPLSPRITYHPGSLSSPTLGLSPDEASSIFSTASAVLHNGADTSHAAPYPLLRASNVSSTLTLARLCLPRRVPLHYISSAGVAIYYPRAEFPPVSLAGTSPPPDGSFGYACSKWVCERLLERLHFQYDLPVCIYRPSTILREGADALTARAELDWVNALLRYIHLIRAAPRMEHNAGALDLVKVETCCRGVVGGITAVDAGKTLRFVNLVGDVVVPLGKMHELDLDKGERYEVLAMREWVARAVAAGLHPSVARLIERMDAEGVDYPRLLKGSRGE